MKKYNVAIIETINYNFVINAESDEKAKDIAFEKMTEGDGFLDKEFFIQKICIIHIFSQYSCLFVYVFLFA